MEKVTHADKDSQLDFEHTKKGMDINVTKRLSNIHYLFI